MPQRRFFPLAALIALCPSLSSAAPGPRTGPALHAQSFDVGVLENILPLPGEIFGFGYMLAGDAFARTGQWDRALEMYRRGMEKDAGNRGAYLFRVGDVQMRQGNREAAIPSYREAVDEGSFEAEKRLKSLGEDYRLRATPLKLFLFPPRKHVRGLSVALLGHDLYTVKGLQTGGLFARARQLRGGQVSGLWNTANDGAGLQAAIWKNRAQKFRGAQVGLWNSLYVPSIRQSLLGIFRGQNPLAELRDSGLTGLQLGAVNMGGAVRGVQAGVLNSALSSKGVRLGALNLGGPASGVELGLLNLHAGKHGNMRASGGLMLGIANGTGGQFTGVQVGFLNVARRMRGVQVGLVNLILQKQGGGISAFPLVNWSF